MMVVRGRCLIWVNWLEWKLTLLCHLKTAHVSSQKLLHITEWDCTLHAFWNSLSLPRIVDYFSIEGKYKLWSVITDLIAGEWVRDFAFSKAPLQGIRSCALVHQSVCRWFNLWAGFIRNLHYNTQHKHTTMSKMTRSHVTHVTNYWTNSHEIGHLVTRP